MNAENFFASFGLMRLLIDCKIDYPIYRKRLPLIPGYVVYVTYTRDLPPFSHKFCHFCTNPWYGPSLQVE